MHVTHHTVHSTSHTLAHWPTFSVGARESTRIVEHDVSWFFFFFSFFFFCFFFFTGGKFPGMGRYHATGCGIYDDTARGTHEGGAAAAADSRMLHLETPWTLGMLGPAVRWIHMYSTPRRRGHGETCGPSNRGRLLRAGVPPSSCTPPSGCSAELVRVGNLVRVHPYIHSWREEWSRYPDYVSIPCCRVQQLRSANWTGRLK